MLSFSSLPPLPPLEPAVVLQPRSLMSQPPAQDQRVAFGALSSPAPGPRPLAPPGTAENPLIPKRRRRTSPQEQKMLEDEFRKNPLPSQAERNRIAERVGMSGRAVQVWLQNRRQKEKKETGHYPSSNHSEPDPDPTDDGHPHHNLSSSPLPSPLINSIRPAPTTTPFARTLSTHSFLPSSASLYNSSTFLPPSSVNKENAPHAHALASTTPANPSKLRALTASATQPAPRPPRQPSFVNETPNPAANSSASAADLVTATPGETPTFVHRASGASVIAAKKHTRKRPLGSHAPLARKPSLPHAFEFPSSPVKAKPLARSASGSGEERPALRRKLGENTTETNATVVVDGRRQVAAGLRMFSEEPQPRPARQGSAVWSGDGVTMSLVEESTGSSDGPEEGHKSSDDLDASQTTNDNNGGAALWSHMMSDPPSERDLFSSPAPLTRKRMLAMAESTFGNSRAPGTPAMATPADRPRRSLAGAKRHTQGSHGRAPSLGNALPSRAEASRAGGEDTCALGALERQFVRMGNEPGLVRRESGASVVGFADDLVSKMGDEEEESEAEEEDEHQPAGLLWATKEEAGESAAGSPARKEAVRALEGLQNSVKRERVEVGDADERECAELLLGLGGGLF